MLSGVFGQYPVEVIGKSLAVGLVQRRRAACIDAAATQGIQKIPDVQTGFYIIGGIPFSARAEGLTAFFNHIIGQGYITGYHQVAVLDPFNDLVIGDVEPGSDLDRADVTGWRHADSLVGYQRQLDPGSLGRFEQNLLDHDRAGVRVHPDLQKESPIINSDFINSMRMP